MDIFPVEKIYQKLTHQQVNKILFTMAQKKYPTCRPLRPKSSWVESVLVKGIDYVLTCHVDVNAEIIVVTNIRVPKKMKKVKKR